MLRSDHITIKIFENALFETTENGDILYVWDVDYLVPLQKKQPVNIGHF